MHHTLTISEGLYARLESEVKRRGLSNIEQLLATIWHSPEEPLLTRQEIVHRIDALRERLFARYGKMNDSVALIREDRAR
jgi:hypothetical protein